MSTATRLAPSPAAQPDWKRALCAQTDPSLFFPDGSGGKVKQDKELAKKVCGRCPIRVACLEWALETGQHAGVWGGLDETERRQLVRQRGDARAHAERGQALVRCLDAQEFIERRAAEGASYRTIAGELGVGHSSVGRACELFQAEREDEMAQGVAAA